ncbi:hypothetical protein D3C78_1764710 [compost metagenome]
MADAQAQTVQMTLRRVALKFEVIRRQGVERDVDLLHVVFVLTLVSVLAEYLGLRGDVVLALQAQPQAFRVTSLIIESQRRGAVALL